MSLPQLIISMLLFLVMFFGIGFLLNMLLRATWIMSILYPIVVILIIDDVRAFEYVTKPSKAFGSLQADFSRLAVADVSILLMGLVGAILSGFTIRILRSKGYQMF